MNKKSEIVNSNDTNIQQNVQKKESKDTVIPEDAPEEYMDTYLAAKDYLEFAPLSRMKLYEILNSEEHPTTHVEIVVNTVQVDWNQNALNKAYNLLQVQGFSKREMMDQLAFEGYSTESIRYAVKKIY